MLEKSTQAKNFISVTDPLNTSGTLEVPAGVYMKMKPNFSTITEDTVGNLVIQGNNYSNSNIGGRCPVAAYPVNIEDPANPGQFIDYTIPQGVE